MSDTESNDKGAAAKRTADEAEAAEATDDNHEDTPFPKRKTVDMVEDDDDYESDDEERGTVRHRAREAHESMEEEGDGDEPSRNGGDAKQGDKASTDTDKQSSADSKGRAHSTRSNDALLPKPSRKFKTPTSQEEAEGTITVSESQTSFLHNSPMGRTEGYSNRQCIEATADVMTRFVSRTVLSIRGRAKNVEQAKFYLDLFLNQRNGQVYLPMEDVEQRDDVTLLPIPFKAAGIVSGKGGSNLRMLEQRFSVLLFYLRDRPFGDSEESADKEESASLLIFGTVPSRCATELKVLSLIDFKLQDYVKPTFITEMTRRSAAQPRCWRGAV
ncbi:hypothetical protein PTSG_06441 [Salpingoeca rosetta]|uniref:K Homology domain-containing protein n=1 Tax=Salpingoeca rosetta (strain ATCC 50818 / BSB-021) TaxID=946362 RepID=F2UFT6_SALR5|nr:uncharacterized protein PTSG_06441 [Salpingoeca rosetta]EGD75364.1 hypothetical protein PTSG_06441 [Salpingoeca rosetta]|eukprot:XP_004991821.1 hypothetical protein PTSG_06441 [Salpingoeca rosetta]